MSEDEERILQDWGGYEPETQKALRFVADLAGKGTAKQMAGAIAREYAKRGEVKPAKAPNEPAIQQGVLSEGDIKVLRLVSGQRGHLDIDQAISVSGLNEDQFFQSIETLKKQRYIAGDVLFGYFRTKKSFPPKQEKPASRRKSAAAQHKVLTEGDFMAIIETWEAEHPQVKLDEEQKQMMLRVHLHMQKYMPGWTL